ncbi:MAG: hypothetical protein ACM3S2_13780 [Ignavibacteriales bacterium]
MSTDYDNSSNKTHAVYDACPHCGRQLSPWEKVLLGVDRMIMCKGCWYRIILDVFAEEKVKTGEMGKTEGTIKTEGKDNIPVKDEGSKPKDIKNK